MTIAYDVEGDETALDSNLILIEVFPMTFTVYVVLNKI